MWNPMLFLTAVCLSAAWALGQGASNSATPASPDLTEVAAIQQIEDEWLQTERTTDLASLERILADDFAGVGPTDLLPTKHSS